MATSQIKAQSHIIELSARAFEAFCEDISGMLGVSVQCNQLPSNEETIDELKKRFERLVAVNAVKAEGALDGTFQLIFDQNGLFTLAGTVVMQPKQRILLNCKSGKTKDAKAMSDAVGETGNMLIGSWDRIFREGFEGHKHFTQSSTFIGKPWDNPEKSIGVTNDGEFLFIPFEMTVGAYQTFNCGVIFPKTIFEGALGDYLKQEASEKDAADKAAAEKAAEEKEAAEKKEASEKEAADKDAADKAAEEKAAAEKAVEEKEAAEKRAIENAAAKKAAEENDTSE